MFAPKIAKPEPQAAAHLPARRAGAAISGADRARGIIAAESAAATRRRDGPSESRRSTARTTAPSPAPAESPRQAIPETWDRPPGLRERLIPDDFNPIAAAGERIIFHCEFDGVNAANHQMEFSAIGGHFDTLAGPAARTIAGLESGSVDFFVAKSWNGKTTVSVTLRLRRISDQLVARTATWVFARKTRYPTKMSQLETTGERPLGSDYTYDIGPGLPDGTKPFYEHQTISERVGDAKIVNIMPADIVEPYRTEHSLKTAADISNHFLMLATMHNGTFIVNSNDQIYDEHSGYDGVSSLPSQLVKPKDIEVAGHQTYEAKPGKTLGAYIITRVLKAGAKVWKLKKGPVSR